ncbi:MAG: PD40 domain-containing protein [Phycisphaerales bacterium]|nr:PD40 domain-containing protein [Phycisphaerales bacterium]
MFRHPFIAAFTITLLAGCAPRTPYHPAPVTKLPTGETDGAAEATMLTNVRPVTDSAMGFARAGEAYFSPDMRTVIFQASATTEDPYQMYTINLDANRNPIRGSVRQVSPGGGACTCGYFRPDGRKIIFGSSYLHPDMPNPNKYQREGSSYAWDMPGGMDIIEANLDGSSPRQLTTEAGYDAECSYNATGDRIVFCSDRDGDPDLYTMNPDGSDVRQITNHDGYDGGPFFSPDGSRVIFRADRRQDDHLQLFVINVDGTGEKQLTPHGDVVRWAPWWLPDGKSIVYASSIHGHFNYEVYLMNIETGRYTRVTWSRGFDGLPVISPDGKSMMWTSKRSKDGTSQVFIADFKLPEGF